MAWERIIPGLQEPVAAGSAIAPGKVVRAAGTTLFHVLEVATCNQEPFGVHRSFGATVGASGLNAREQCPVQLEGNFIKMIAGASMGANADVGVASTSGQLGPIVGASGAVVWRAGKSMTPAAAGEFFTLYVKPRQLSGLV